MRLDLKRITAVGFQGKPYEENNPDHLKMLNRIKKSLTYMVRFFDFHEIIFISPVNPEVEGVTHIQISGSTYEDYNKWCLHNLSDYVTTDFGLSFQDDGFPLNPEMWSDEYYNYDYVGAPLPLDTNIMFNPDERIGGGGFTLRSKKLMEFTKTIPYPDKYGKCNNEDTIIVMEYRKDIINLGMKICPHTIARNFVIQTAIDDNHTLLNTFGYHGRDGKLDVVDKIMDERLLNLNNEVV